MKKTRKRHRPERVALDLDDLHVQMLIGNHFAHGGPILDNDPWIPPETIAELWQGDLGQDFYRHYLEDQVRFPNTQRPTPWALRRWGPPGDR